MVPYKTDVAERLLQAAEGIARAHDLKTVTLDGVCAAAEIERADAVEHFAGDQALREALARRYDNANRDVLGFTLRDVTSIDDFVRQTRQAVELYYAIFCQDPQMRDVWVEILTDRSMRQVNLEQVTANSEIILETLHQLLPNVDDMQLTALVELMIHMTDVAARWAAVRGAAKGEAMVQWFCRMIALVGAELVRLDHGMEGVTLPRPNASLS